MSNTKNRTGPSVPGTEKLQVPDPANEAQPASQNSSSNGGSIVEKVEDLKSGIELLGEENSRSAIAIGDALNDNFSATLAETVIQGRIDAVENITGGFGSINGLVESAVKKPTKNTAKSQVGDSAKGSTKTLSGLLASS